MDRKFVIDVASEVVPPILEGLASEVREAQARQAQRRADLAKLTPSHQRVSRRDRRLARGYRSLT